VDLLDRLLIIKTVPYTVVEVMQIVDIRAKIESLELENEALGALGEIGKATSLRYVMQLLTPAAILAKTTGREVITRADVEEADGLFFDAKSSARLLIEQADKYIS
jgi:RuvB-like protein 1 (pontin 52)